MTKQDNNAKSLAVCSIIFVTLTLLGSFVVSFNVVDFIYLVFFYVFLLIYKIIK